MASAERLQKLQAMLARQPQDVFLLYAVALEHKKAGSAADALNYLRQALEVDPLYPPAFQQMGIICESIGDIEAAKSAYRQGIAAASTRGDAHAREEMSGALSMLG